MGNVMSDVRTICLQRRVLFQLPVSRQIVHVNQVNFTFPVSALIRSWTQWVPGPQVWGVDRGKFWVNIHNKHEYSLLLLAAITLPILAELPLDGPSHLALDDLGLGWLRPS